MELHSYAKHKAAKKWTIEQKRRLIESRIRHEKMFQMHPSSSKLPWRRVVNDAQLTDFNEAFAKRQWSCIISKYIQYKSANSNGVESLSPDIISKITDEWEFFERIHAYMTRQTANLHSYALSSAKNESSLDMDSAPGCSKAALINKSEWLEGRQTIKGKIKPMQTDGSDTNEDGEKDAANEQKHGGSFVTLLSLFQNCTAKTHRRDAAPAEVIALVSSPSDQISFADAAGNGTLAGETNNCSKKAEMEANKSPNMTPTSSLEGTDIYSPTRKHPRMGQADKIPQRKISERDKYYRHKRRFNRRLERRFDAVLSVAAQIAKAEYPSIDVSGLLKQTTTAVRNAWNGALSSEDDTTSSAADTEDRLNQRLKTNPL